MKVWWCLTPAYALSGAPYHLNYTCREGKYSKLSPLSPPLPGAVLNHNLPGALLHWACLSLWVRLQTAPPPRQPRPTRAGSWHKIYFAPEYTVNQKNALTTGGSGQQWTQKEADSEKKAIDRATREARHGHSSCIPILRAKPCYADGALRHSIAGTDNQTV